MHGAAKKFNRKAAGCTEMLSKSNIRVKVSDFRGFICIN